MAKKNRISINAFDEAAGIIDEVNEIKWNELSISVKRRIKYEEMVLLISAASEASFGEDGSFHPEATEFALRLGAIALYTNLSVPANIEKRYDMAFGTDVYDKIEEAIDPLQIKMIRDAIERRVGIRARAAVEAVIRQANEVGEAISQLKDKIEGQFNAVLGDIDPDEMNRILHSMADGGFDEEKVVRAYMDFKSEEGQSGEETHDEREE